MKKICASITSTAMLLFFVTIPIIGMEPVVEQPDVETLYKKLASKEMPELKSELKKIKDDTVLLALLGYNNNSNVTNAASWELLSRFCAEKHMLELFEKKQKLPKLSASQQGYLRINFLKFVGLYIAKLPEFDREKKALFSLQSVPDLSIAQFVFVKDKILILKNDYQTLALFDFKKNLLNENNELLQSTGKSILLELFADEAKRRTPSVLTVSDDGQFSQFPLSIGNDKIAKSNLVKPFPVNTEKMPFSTKLSLKVLMIINELSTNTTINLLEKTTLDNLLFLVYLCNYPLRAMVTPTNPILKRELADSYNALPEEITERLNLSIEGSSAAQKRSTVAAAKAVSKKQLDYNALPEAPKAAQHPDPAAIKRHLIYNKPAPAASVSPRAASESAEQQGPPPLEEDIAVQQAPAPTVVDSTPVPAAATEPDISWWAVPTRVWNWISHPIESLTSLWTRISGWWNK